MKAFISSILLVTIFLAIYSIAFYVFLGIFLGLASAADDRPRAANEHRARALWAWRAYMSKQEKPKPAPPEPPKKSCECSEKCECGCNQGQACSCPK